MEKKRSVGIIIISIIIFLCPFILKILFDMVSLLSTGVKLSWTWSEFIRSFWPGFIFYVILGIGILKLNNKIRFLTVVITTAMAAAGPLGLTMGYFFVGYKIHAEIIKKYGITVILYPWLAVFIVCLLCALIAFYLTRPKVKEQFR